jgi:16S rRNA G527 N7-methylase RsmG
VVAELRPELHITLVDRRAKRTDALERAIASLGWGNRVRVVCADVGALTRQDEWRETFDAVMSRGFGPHETTLKYSAALVRSGGTVLLSEPPAGSKNRWEDAVVAGAELEGPELILHLARFTKKTER